jgi:hypothetical protein
MTFSWYLRNHSGLPDIHEPIDPLDQLYGTSNPNVARSPQEPDTPVSFVEQDHRDRNQLNEIARIATADARQLEPRDLSNASTTHVGGSPGLITENRPVAQQSSIRSSTRWPVIGIAISCVLLYIGGVSLLATVLLWIVALGSGAVAVRHIATAISSDTKESDKSGAWITAAFCLGLGFAAWLFIPAPAETDPVPTRAASPKSRAQQTLEYWNAIAVATKELDVPEAKTSADYVKVLRSVASQIDRLPTANVDEDAVQTGSALQLWLDSFADQVDRQNSPESTISILASGLRGDFLGPILDAVEVDQSNQARSSTLRLQLRSTRALLSSRYSVEFQHLD